MGSLPPSVAVKNFTQTISPISEYLSFLPIASNP